MSKLSQPMTAFQFAEQFLKDASLPTTDGKNISPIPVERVRELMTQVVQADRTAGVTLDFMAIARKIIPDPTLGDVAESDATPTLPEVEQRRKVLVHTLNYAQACGARFKPGNPTEDDYTECVAETCEFFLSALKNRGFAP